MPGSLRPLLHVIQRHRRTAGLILGLTVVASVADGVVVWLFLPLLKSLVNAAPGDAGKSAGLLLFATLIGLCAFRAGVHIWRTRSVAQLRWRVREEWIDSLFAGALYGDFREMANAHTGRTLDTLHTKTREASTCLWAFMECVAAGSHVAVLIVLLLILHWPTGLSLLAVLGLGGCAVWPIRNRFTVALGKQQVRHSQESKRVSTETILGLRDIRAYGAESRFADRLRKPVEAFSRVMVRQATVSAIPHRLNELLILGCLFALFLIAPMNGVDQSIGIVPVGGFAYFVLRRLMTSGSKTFAHGISIATLLPNLEFISRKLYGNETALEHVSTKQEPQQLVVEEFDIRAEGLAFAYPGQKPVFEDSSFVVPANQLTLVTGASGSGKSTLADLLTGFVSPTDGQVCAGDVSLSQIPLSEWRRLIGYVPQDAFLFHDSIRENLLLGNPDASETELYEACEAAQAWNFICRLPDGLDHVVGERGNQLSGGQRQRLALARAIVRRPYIYLFDEPTTGLDAENRRQFWQAVKQLRRNHIVIVIAHHAPEDLEPDNTLQILNDRITPVEAARFSVVPTLPLAKSA